MLQLTSVLNLLLAPQEIERGLLQLKMVMSLGEGQMRVLLRRSRWNLRVKAKPLRFVVKWFFLDHQIPHEYNSMELHGVL